MKVHFQEGQVVRAGDLLAEIDPRSYEAQLSQAEGQLARDQALLANAMIDLERYRLLFKQDSIAKQQLDTQESLVRQYEGTLKVDRAAIDTAKLMLSYCRITAPVSGRLGLRQVDAGNIVRASDQGGLVVITQLQPVTVVFTIPEDNVRNVMRKLRAREKMPVEAWDRADKIRLAGGALLTADNQIDTTTGTVKLKAQFANEDYGLFPNQFVNARLLLEVKKGVTSIPSAAVQRGRQGTFVYVVKDDGSVTVRNVTLGPAQGEVTSVESGIAPGERVVVDGADKLREGAKVDTEAGSRPPPGARKGGDGKGGGRKGGPGGK
jgi:multidrug efflux system membrane fusion protein